MLDLGCADAERERTECADARRVGIRRGSHHAGLHDRKLATTVGDEGGFAPSLGNNEAALQVISEAVEKAGYTPGRDVFFAMDAAVTELYENGKYVLPIEGKTLAGEEMVAMWEDWCNADPSSGKPSVRGWLIDLCRGGDEKLPVPKNTAPKK